MKTLYGILFRLNTTELLEKFNRNNYLVAIVLVIRVCAILAAIVSLVAILLSIDVWVFAFVCILLTIYASAFGYVSSCKEELEDSYKEQKTEGKRGKSK